MIPVASDRHAVGVLPLVSVLIVTYNSASTIDECLTRLGAAMDVGVGGTVDGAVEVIVRDNASTDDTVARLRAHPLAARAGVRIVDSGDNAGFGAGNNAIAAVAAAPLLLLLNPDAFLDDPAAIDRLVAAMRAADARIAGPVLLNADGSHQVGDAGHEETLAVAALWSLGLNMLPGTKGSYLSRAYPASAPPLAVDWVCGACLLIEAALFRELGGFDTDIFLYSEDVDLCVRARRQGARVVYVPAVRVRHVQGVSSGPERISTTWLASRFALFDRAGDGGRVRRAAFAGILGWGFAWRWPVYLAAEAVSPARRARGMASRMKVFLGYSVRQWRGASR